MNDQVHAGHSSMLCMHAWKDACHVSPHAIKDKAYLSSQGLEEGCWSHNGMRDVTRLSQLRFEGQLGMLKLQERLLDAHSAEEHKVRAAACPCSFERIQSRLVGDCPGVPLHHVENSIMQACSCQTHTDVLCI